MFNVIVRNNTIFFSRPSVTLNSVIPNDVLLIPIANAKKTFWTPPWIDSLVAASGV